MSATGDSVLMGNVDAAARFIKNEAVVGTLDVIVANFSSRQGGLPMGTAVLYRNGITLGITVKNDGFIADHPSQGLGGHFGC